MFDRMHQSSRDGAQSLDATFYLAERIIPGRLVAEAAQLGFERSLQAIVTMTHELQRHWARRRAQGSLASLPSHALKDIGFDRSEIGRVVMDIERGVDPRHSPN